MGLPFIAFFGDKTKVELEKELERVNAEIAAETDTDKIVELETEKAELLEALEKAN